MNRFGLFVTVFSIGFVLFLVISNQIERLFREDENPFVEPETQQSSPADRNRVEFNQPHPKYGHLFTLRGTRENPGALSVDENTNLDFGNLVDAEIEFPSAESLEGGLKLTAERVIPDRGAKKLTLGGTIRATRATGDTDSELETTNVEIDWSRIDRAKKDDPDSNFVLTGHDPIRIRYPSLEALGQGGFSGRLDGQYELETLRLEPPVLISVSQTRGNELFGMGASTARDPAKDGADPESEQGRVLVHSSGPVTLEQGAEGEAPRLRFEERVHIWRVEQYAGLDPEMPIPDDHFRCEKLELRLSQKGMQVESATAWGGVDRLEFHFSDPLGRYVLTGDQLEWSRERAEAELLGTETIHFAGPWGEFEAGRGWFDVAERRVRLLGEVRALVLPTQLGGLDAERLPRLAQPFEFVADRIDVTLARESRSDAKHPIERLVALGSARTPITVREPGPIGIRLTGDRLEFDGATQTISLTSSEELPGRRPVLREGASQLTAAVIRGSFADLELILEGDVTGHAVDLAQFETVASSAPSEAAPEGADRAEIAAERLRVVWKEITGDPSGSSPAETKTELALLEATGTDEKPLTLAYEKEGVDYHFSGDQLEWKTESDELVVRGERPQRLAMQRDGLEVAGHEIRAHVGSRRVHAHGAVEAHASQRFLSEQRIESPGQGREQGGDLELRGDSIEFVLAPSDSETGEARAETLPGDRGRPGDKPETVGSDSSSSDGLAFGLGRTRILSAIARSEDPRRPVFVSDGVLTLRGEIVTFDAKAQTASIAGANPETGRQEVVYLAEDGTARTLIGRSIGVATDGPRIRITVDRFEGELVQKSKREKASRTPLVWNLTAERVEAWLARVAVPTDDEVHSRVALDEIRAKGDLKVSNAALQVSLDGDSAQWTAASQRLRLFDERARGLQSLQHGPADSPDEVLAREIRILVDPAADDRAIVLLEEVLNATFMIRDEHRRSERTPRKFQLETSQLIIRLTQSPNPALTDDHRIDEAFALGGATFKAADAQVLCDRIDYKGDRVIFRGKEGQPPQIIKGDGPRRISDPLVYELSEESRGKIVLPRGVDAQAMQDLTDLIQYFADDGEKRDRR